MNSGVAYQAAPYSRYCNLAGFTALLCLTSFCLAGCEEHTQELEERVTQLQKELDHAQTDLQNSRQEVISLKAELHRTSEPVRPTPVPTKIEKEIGVDLPPRETLEQSYMSAAKNLKRDLQEQLRGFSLEKCILHHIEYLSASYPVTSRISLAVRSSAGLPIQFDVPVKADGRGNWVFPETSAIIRQIESDGRQTLSSEAKAAAPEAPRSAPASNISSSGLSTQQSVVIQWPDDAQAAGRAPAGSASPANPQPTPSSRVAPKPPPSKIHADREVLIEF